MEIFAPSEVLEGVITNCQPTSARFIDLGVHQDGLIHISQLGQHLRQRPPREIVSVGRRRESESCSKSTWTQAEIGRHSVSF